MLRLFFIALPNNERDTKYRGLTYSAKQTVREICRATYSASQTRLRIYLTVSITVVQPFETPQNTPKHPKHIKLPLNRIYSRYHKMRDFLGHSWPFPGVGDPWSSTGITGIGLNDRQLFWKANTCFVLVNDLYIGDPLEANKTGNMHIPVRLCSWTHWIIVESTPSPAVCIRSFNRIPQSKSMHIMPRGHIETDPSTSRYFVTFSLECPKYGRDYPTKFFVSNLVFVF